MIESEDGIGMEGIGDLSGQDFLRTCYRRLNKMNA